MIPVATAPRSTAATTPFVVVEDHGVVAQAFQPFQRGRTPFQRRDRADQRQEVGVGRRDRDLAFPFRLRQIEQGARAAPPPGSCRCCRRARFRAPERRPSRRADPLSLAGTLANVAGATFASSPFSDSNSSSGEFSVKKTSAGDDFPSFTNWLASSGASPEWTLTSIPVSLVNALVSKIDGLLVLRGIERERRRARAGRDHAQRKADHGGGEDGRPGESETLSSCISARRSSLAFTDFP